MKKTSSILILICFSMMCVCFNGCSKKWKNFFKWEKKFKGEIIEVDAQNRDINGDGIEESIILSGEEQWPKSYPFLRNFKLTIKKQQTNKNLAKKELFKDKIEFTRSAPIFFGDFNNDGIDDIMITRYQQTRDFVFNKYKIISFKNNKFTEIPLDYIEKSENIFLKLNNDYTLSVYIKELEKPFIVPLSEELNVRFKNAFAQDKSLTGDGFVKAKSYFLRGNFKLDPIKRIDANSYKLKQEFYLTPGLGLPGAALIKVIYEYNNSKWAALAVDGMLEFGKRTAQDIQKKLTKDDLKIGNISIGTQYETVVENMGAAIKEDASKRKLIYNGLIVYFENEKNKTATCLEISSSKYITPRGLKIGSSKDEIKNLYGTPDRISKFQPDTDSWKYFDENLNCLEIFVKNNAVNGIFMYNNIE